MTDPNACPYCNLEHRPDGPCPEQPEDDVPGYRILARMREAEQRQREKTERQGERQ